MLIMALTMIASITQVARVERAVRLFGGGVDALWTPWSATTSSTGPSNVHVHFIRVYAQHLRAHTALQHSRVSAPAVNDDWGWQLK